MHRVQKLLSNYGYCSRRKAEELIKEGRVKVNGKIIEIGDKAGEKDKISVDNKPVRKQKNVYLMFNKPIGCVTALTDSRFKTIMDYVRTKERVFPIGRLDFNTSGLLLLTNDGDFANTIMHPRYEIKKTYQVRLNKPLVKKDSKKIEQGMELEDGKTSPAKIVSLTPTFLEITIHEGKNRIIRRMFKALGYGVVSLGRVRIGKLLLGKLKNGHYRALKESEKQAIFEK